MGIAIQGNLNLVMLDITDCSAGGCVNIDLAALACGQGEAERGAGVRTGVAGAPERCVALVCVDIEIG